MSGSRETFCVEHGRHVWIDERGCCNICGNKAVGPFVDVICAHVDRIAKESARWRRRAELAEMALVDAEQRLRMFEQNAILASWAPCVTQAARGKQ